ncbi:hypothetical protein HYALB_00002579 [Hymenoscyphus albidus]|uniref:M protein repeat protein n=1 Tax=Hymenoscyphus albidus TaxID=595503 RepID=A0A9N9QAW4_9HELO|nr:hypothetical protein HYALB_00002579 [Hymenoscyphus albidus]
MADAEAIAKAEKIAAAKKRVDAMKKKKKTGAKKEDKPEPSPVAETSKVEEDPSPEPPPVPEPVNEEEAKPVDQANEDAEAEEAPAELNVAKSHGRQPSLSLQSKLRSSSFRQGAGAGQMSPGYVFSPDGETAPDIHRKQQLRIDELERENKRLAKEAGDSEKRWKKAEEELEELREAEDDTETKTGAPAPSAGSLEELEKLRTENAALQRHNTQLQAQSSKATRHGSSPSVSANAPPDYEAALASKSSTIEGMEIEISNLRAHLEKVNSGASVKEQVSALEEKLARSEKATLIAQRELGDLKKNLERTTEKAVKEGSERTSAETKLRTLERESDEAKAHSEELQKKVEALEKKVSTLGTLHKEHDARFQAQKKEREKAEKDASELRSRLAGLENENQRLKDERERARKRDAQGIDDEGVDELENEERQRLEKKVRNLEGEVHELRRGVWRERRKELEGDDTIGSTSPSAKFTDIDLGGMSPSSRRKSLAQGGGKGLGDFITSGFNAITGAASGADDSLLEDDEDMDFDEDAFRLAQEEEAKARIERVKEVKRGLKNWEGWRLDLVENRRGGGEGFGEIFEI